MARDGVRQPRAQHHKLVLPLAFRRPNCAPHGIVHPPQLALGAGIHVPHAHHYGVRLVIQIQAVGNQLFKLDLRRPFKRTPSTRPPAFATVATIGAISMMLARASTTATAARPISSAAGTS